MHAAQTGSVAHAVPKADNTETPLTEMRAANGETATEEEARANFAKAMGFGSFDKLVAASAPVASNDGKAWYLTALPDGNWGAWNDVQLLFERHFASREEALASIPHDDEVSGSAMLG